MTWEPPRKRRPPPPRLRESIAATAPAAQHRAPALPSLLRRALPCPLPSPSSI